MTYNIQPANKALLVLIGTLLSSAAWFITPANADASLDELKAKLEKAERENIVLKTEKIERENITMKLEKIEAENATLRNEAKVDKTPTASIPTKKPFSNSSSSQEVKTVARREVIEANSPASRDHVAARREMNHALDSIPKNDPSRDMTAAYKTPREEVPVVVKQWQGIYAGISAGYGEAYVPYTTTMLGPAVGYFSGNITPTVFNTNQYPTLSSNNSSEALSGPVVGGQVGYNYQFSNRIVLGIETDLHYSDINNRYSPNYKFSQNNQNGIYTGSIVSGASIPFVILG